MATHGQCSRLVAFKGLGSEPPFAVNPDDVVGVFHHEESEDLRYVWIGLRTPTCASTITSESFEQVVAKLQGKATGDNPSPVESITSALAIIDKYRGNGSFATVTMDSLRLELIAASSALSEVASILRHGL